MSDVANPYETPASTNRALPPSSGVSVLRGIACAIPASAIGFLIPYVVVGVQPFIRHAFFGYSALDRDADLHQLPRFAFTAAAGCAMVFALAAIINYGPARRVGLVRALMYAGLSALLAGVVAIISTHLLGAVTRGHPPDPKLLIAAAIGVGVFILCGVSLLVFAFRR